MRIETIKILSSRRFIMPDGEPGWCVDTEVQLEGEDKPRWIPHTFPDSCFAYRAVEYEIDPTDIEKLLDVILLENYIRRDDVEFRTTIYGSASVDETRDAHLNRCAQVKLRHRVSTRANKSTLRARAAKPDDPMTVEQAEAEHPLDKIRNHMAEKPIRESDLSMCRRMVYEHMDRLGIERPKP